MGLALDRPRLSNGLRGPDGRSPRQVGEDPGELGREDSQHERLPAVGAPGAGWRNDMGLVCCCVAEFDERALNVPSCWAAAYGLS
jgi:hypothetical protein